MAQESSTAEIYLHLCLIARTLALKIAHIKEKSLTHLAILDQFIYIKGQIRQVLIRHLRQLLYKYLIVRPHIVIRMDVNIFVLK